MAPMAWRVFIRRNGGALAGRCAARIAEYDGRGAADGHQPDSFALPDFDIFDGQAGGVAARAARIRGESRRALGALARGAARDRGGEGANSGGAQGGERSEEHTSELQSQ